MTQADLECLKSHVDQLVEIDTRNGEHLRIKVISVFDGEADPDVFFDVVEDGTGSTAVSQTGCSLALHEIVAVKPVRV